MATTAESAIANLRDGGLEDVLYVPGQQTYDASINSYWSLTPRLKPWAIVQPRNTEEVAAAVKALVKTPNCNFAVRSGGHTCRPGDNGIEAGVTIDLGLMAATTYNPETKLASLQPGGRWADVCASLEKLGVMVAGGRHGLVGVGGLLLGGGKTFYTCRVGFACDQVVNYEVVLADGTIVEANNTTNPDLFLVLKGGSNNFGIVTRFDMVTFPAHDIWDGFVAYPNAAHEKLLNSFVSFTKNLAQQPDGHVWCMWVYSPEAKACRAMLMLTNLDGVENAPSFKEFLDIPGSSGPAAMKITTVANKLSEMRTPSDKEDIWFTLTFKADSRILKKATDAYENLMEECTKLVPDGKFDSFLMLQPLPASFARHSVDRGNNMFGLERVHEDSVLFAARVGVDTSEQAQLVRPRFKAAVEEIESYAMSVDGNVEFRYLNYCDGSQDPLSSYGAENINKMRQAAIKYDPTGVFQTRVPGGFKISNVK